MSFGKSPSLTFAHQDKRGPEVRMAPDQVFAVQQTQFCLAQCGTLWQASIEIPIKRLHERGRRRVIYVPQADRNVARASVEESAG